MPVESSMDMPDYPTAEEIRSETIDDKHLSMVLEYVLCGYPSMRAEIQKDL